MERLRMMLVLCLCGLLTGCASLLEREYTSVEPHSGKFWESEAADILRAEDYQDIVNDLLLLVNRHTETATLRLYDFEDEAQVLESLEQAAREVQLETPMGAYAVEYITSASQAQRGYHEATIQIGYRRTAEQIQSMVTTTSTGAVTGLLENALDAGATELAVRISYWGPNGQAEVEELAARLREARELTEEAPWVINLYPAEGTVGVVEFLMDPEQDPEAVRWERSVVVRNVPQAEESKDQDQPSVTEVPVEVEEEAETPPDTVEEVPPEEVPEPEEIP